MSVVATGAKERLLFDGPEWTFETMQRAYDGIEEIALNDLGLDTYPNQIEIISAEQMLDAYAANGLPLMYQHWSFGKHFVHEETMYRKGFTSLAYEIVINSNPCISYNMEENSMPLQALVMAHAAFGHNHFFKNNYLFRQWSDASGVLDYIAFAKSYIAKCEERYGADAVEEILDAGHALMSHAVFRYHRPPAPTADEREARRKEREQFEQVGLLEYWTDSLVGAKAIEDASQADERERRRALQLPEENLLYFVEKYAVKLEAWQREVLRIIRTLSQYLYPQRQTKVINEGCACFVHYYIMTELRRRGLVSESAFLEMLHHHTNVIAQPDFDDPRFGGINPYALGFAMMTDLQRICLDPTDEDREWFPEFAGNPDWRSVLKGAWANYRDESFILQFLSPKVIRDFRFFSIEDDAGKPELEVTQIHDSAGYREMRRQIAESYSLSRLEPDIQAVDADLRGSRELKLVHQSHDGIELHPAARDAVLTHLERLWGYDVSLTTADARAAD
jgi:stage V sporulation protein R